MADILEAVLPDGEDAQLLINAAAIEGGWTPTIKVLGAEQQSPLLTTEDEVKAYNTSIAQAGGKPVRTLNPAAGEYIVVFQSLEERDNPVSQNDAGVEAIAGLLRDHAIELLAKHTPIAPPTVPMTQAESDAYYADHAKAVRQDAENRFRGKGVVRKKAVI